MIPIRVTIKNLDNVLKALDPKTVERATVRALNRTVSSAKTEASSILREKYNVKKSDLDPKLSIMNADYSNLTAKLTLTGDPISLTRFNPVQIRGGVRTFIKQGMAQKKVRSGNFAGVRTEIFKGKTRIRRPAFMAMGKNSVPLVFERIRGSQSPERFYKSGKPKEKLRALKVVTYPSMLKQPQYMSRLKEHILEQWQKNIDHELKKGFRHGKK